MSQTWQVYKDGKLWKELEASQIRALLKSGEISPTDEVAAPSSSLRRSVFEVDEIFESEDSTPFVWMEESEADKTQISLEVQPIESKIQVKKLFEPIVNVISEHRSRSKQRARSRVKPRDRSLYFLVNPDGKVSGPHPSSSILAMFHRGLISKKLRVKKYGSTETISISKFVLDLSRKSS